MTDASPFEPFEPAAPPTAPANNDPPKRNRRTRGRPAKASQPAKVLQVAAEPPAPKKRGRKPKAVGVAPNSARVDLQTAIAAVAGLKPEDVLLVGQMVTALGKVPKASRTRIVSALDKLFT